MAEVVNPSKLDDETVKIIEDDIKEYNKINNLRPGMKGYKMSRLSIQKMVDKKGGFKHRQETKDKISKSLLGDKCYNWQGGLSVKKYSVDWTRSLRISIRERDEYVCKICGEKQGDIAHAVHHIDYNKANCNPDNLITLCKSCHHKTNFNRDNWKEYFKKVCQN